MAGRAGASDPGWLCRHRSRVAELFQIDWIVEFETDLAAFVPDDPSGNGRKIAEMDADRFVQRKIADVGTFALEAGGRQILDAQSGMPTILAVAFDNQQGSRPARTRLAGENPRLISNFATHYVPRDQSSRWGPVMVWRC